MYLKVLKAIYSLIYIVKLQTSLGLLIYYYSHRALQRKIRAEEMLKAASLPPSMAKREKHKTKPCVCPRSYRDFGIEDPRNIQNHFLSLDEEFEELRKEFLSPVRHPTKKKRGKRVIDTSA